MYDYSAYIEVCVISVLRLEPIVQSLTHDDFDLISYLTLQRLKAFIHKKSPHRKGMGLSITVQKVGVEPTRI